MNEALPQYRAEPFRIFFPLGAAIAAAGVIPWLLFSLGQFGWLSRPHAITEVQGFLTTFAAGFLFTFLPRRLKTPKPAAWEALPVLLGCVAVPVLAWANQERVAHWVWAAMVALLVVFAVRRLLPGLRVDTVPAAFTWIPVALAFGVVSAVLGAGAWIWQGVFGGLILGIGVLMLPVMTHNESWPVSSGGLPQWLVHGGGMLVFFASFPLERTVGLHGGLLLRGAAALVLMVAVGRAWRYPQVPGFHRKVAWVSAWLFPVGYLLAGLVRAHWLAMLHVTFIGGFALLTLSVGNHVLVAHTGNKDLLRVSPWRLRLFAIALVGAALVRVTLPLFPQRLLLTVGIAASLFLVAVLAWFAWTVPALRRAPPSAPY